MPVIYDPKNDPRRSNTKIKDNIIITNSKSSVHVTGGENVLISHTRGRNTNILVGVLIGANAAVFGAWNFGSINKILFQNFCCSKAHVISGRWWTMVSYAFSHKQFGHLASNMFSLWSSGKIIGKKFGPAYTFGIYILGALGSAAAHFLWHQNPRDTIIGASGATFALLAAAAVAAPETVLPVRISNNPVPIQWYTKVILLCEVVLLLVDNEPVSHIGHLGGAVVGLLCGLVLKDVKTK